MANNFILYFAYGDLYVKECLFSIASLINTYNKDFPEELKVLVYTDLPDSFQIFHNYISQITTEYIDSKTVEEWSNGTDNILRTKIVTLKYFFSNHNNALALFVDTDVVFERKIDKLFKLMGEGWLLMHSKEAKLSYKDFHYFLEPYNGKVFYLASGRKVEIHAESEMWNSGVIGLASKNAAFLNDVLELNDILYQISPLRLVEQFSFSTIFCQEKRLRYTKNYIFHYCHIKEGIRSRLKTLFIKPQNIYSFLTRARKIRPRMISYSTIIESFNFKVIIREILKKLRGYER